MRAAAALYPDHGNKAVTANASPRTERRPALIAYPRGYERWPVSLPTAETMPGESMTPTPTGAYSRAALDYWQAGWRGVLPLPARRKHDPPKGFTGINGAWPSYADVYAWCDGPEGAGNIALRMPENVIGIDVDHYDDKRGGDTYADAIAEYGALPATWCSTSRTDGISRIRFFRVPEGMAWPGELGTDVEIIQHSHRYAVVWPSTHPDGGTYHWTDPAGTLGGPVPAVDALPPLPEAWIAGLTGGALADGLTRADFSTRAASLWLAEHVTDGPACRRTAAAISAALVDLSAGSRHTAARLATGRLVRLGCEGHTGTIAALGQIRAAFLGACADGTRGTVRKPGEAEHEFLSLVAGAVNLVQPTAPAEPPPDPCEFPHAGIIAPSPAGGAPLWTPPTMPTEPTVHTIAETVPVPEAALQQSPYPPSAPLPAAPGITDPLVIHEVTRQRAMREARKHLDHADAMATFREVPHRHALNEDLAMPEEHERYTIDQLMPVGANVVLTAQYKVGKTTMINHLARCLADKEPYLAQFDVHELTGRIALFNYEVDTRQYIRWLRECNIAHPERITTYNLRGYNYPLIVKHVQDFVVNWLQRHEIEVWVIDPFARAFVGCGDENSNADVGQFLDTIDVIKERAGVSNVVMPAHTGRGGQTEGAERARGATRIDDWADARWLYTTNPVGERFFKASGRDVDVPEGRIDLRPERQLQYVPGESRATSRADDLAVIVMRVVNGRPGLGYAELRSAVREETGSLTNADLSRARNDLMRRNRLVYVPPANGSKGRHYAAGADPVMGGDA